MTEVVLFHHVQGLTEGVRALADALRAGGHTVHTPDFFEGATFGSLEEGFAARRERGDLDAWADGVVADLPEELVYAGISLGVMPAQRLAQTRPGAAGAILMESCLPISGDWAIGPWPDGVPVQIHGMDADEFFAGEGDIEAAREIVATVPDAELFTYPGQRHLFTDRSLPSHDVDAAAQVVSRSLAFLGRLG